MPHTFPRRRAASLLAALLLTTAALSGCDANKEKRAALAKQIAGLDAELARLKDAQARASRDIEALTSETNLQAISIQQQEARLTKLQDELMSFVMEHKLATVAVLAAGGGAAGVLNDNLDQESRDMLKAAGLLGAGYCLFNLSECGDVTSRILYFGTQMEATDKGIKDLRARLSRNLSSLKEREAAHAALGDAFRQKTGERASLQQSHDGMLCKYCL